MLKARTLVVMALACLAAFSHSQIVWDESVNGDLSGDRLDPTSLTLSFGTNSLIATSGPGDREYVHFHLNPGQALGQIIVTSYVSDDPIAFIGVQAGTVFTEPHEDPEPSNLLGYMLFGDGHVGTDILPAMGQAFGTIGFTPPLTGPDYTFWIQQTGNPATYNLNFVVVPEPATLSLGLGVGLLLLKRRRKA